LLSKGIHRRSAITANLDSVSPGLKQPPENLLSARIVFNNEDCIHDSVYPPGTKRPAHLHFHSSKNTVFDNFHFSFRSSSRKSLLFGNSAASALQDVSGMALSFLAQGGDGQQEARIRLVR
jgi:hypothetical protein